MPKARRLEGGTTLLRVLRRKTCVKVGAFTEHLPCTRTSYVSVENGNRPASPELGEAIAQRLTALGQPATYDELFEPTAAKKPNVNEPGNPPPQPPAAPKPKQPTRKTRSPQRIDSVAGAA